MTVAMQDVNQAFLTKKKLPQNSTNVVSSSSSSSECLSVLLFSSLSCSRDSCVYCLDILACCMCEGMEWF